MIPVFFPYTYISDDSAKTIHAFLGKFDVLQPSGVLIPEPMKSLADSKLIDIISPLTVNDDLLIESVKAFQEWGRLHQGKGLSYFKAEMGKIPNYDVSSTTRLKSELDRLIRQKSLPEKKPLEDESDYDKYLWWSRVFLQIAQAFDASQHEMKSALLQINQMEKALFQQMKGKNSEDDFYIDKSGSASGSDEFKDDNILERIKAWAGLYFQMTNRSGIFVTDSSHVIDHLIERGVIPETSSKVRPLTINEESDDRDKWKNGLLNQLIAITDGNDLDANKLNIDVPLSSNHDGMGNLEIFCAKGISPSAFLSGFIADRFLEENNLNINKKIINSVICYIYRGK